MKKYSKVIARLLTLSILLITPHAHASFKMLYGTVCNDKGEPIAQCTVTLLPSGHAVRTNINGVFTLYYNADTVQTITLYHMGYQNETTRINNDTMRIVLKYKINELKETTIGAGITHITKKYAIMGNKDLKPFGECYGNFGNEKAIFLSADSSRHGLLQQACFYIADDGIPDTRFRVHVYDIDTNYLPGTDLLDSVVTAQAHKGNEWVCVDLSTYRIAVGRGLFVSIEWVQGYGNTTQPVPSRKHRYEPRVYGQVLALTESYRKKGSLMYQRKNADSPWNYIVAGGTGKRNLLNPAIYATYMYVK